MRLKILALTATLLAPASALALDEQKAGELEALMEERRAAIAKEYGDKKPSEMSSSERRAYYQKIEAANREVLQQNGISDKEYARATARMGRGSMQRIEQAKKEFAEKRAAEKKAKEEQAKKGSGEIQIQRGFDNKNPVTLDEPETDGPVIERGNPEGVRIY